MKNLPVCTGVVQTGARVKHRQSKTAFIIAVLLLNPQA
jgi:hypothetical protein